MEKLGVKYIPEAEGADVVVYPANDSLKKVQTKLFRDVEEVQARNVMDANKDPTPNFAEVKAPQFQLCEKEIWVPTAIGEVDEQAIDTSLETLKDAQKHKSDAQKKKVLDALESGPANTLVFILTFYCLFSDDVRVGLFTYNDNADIVFAWNALVAMTLFAIEVIIKCVCQKGYALSFFFFLDLLATVSMVFEVLPVFGISYTEIIDPSAARAGRAARLGTRVGRLLRVFRVVRVVKLVSLIGNKSKAKEANTPKKVATASAVGKALNERISQKVIIGVLVTMVLFPLMQAPTISDDSERHGLSMVLQLYEAKADAVWSEGSWEWRNPLTREDVQNNATKTTFKVAINEYYWQHQNSERGILLQMKVGDFTSGRWWDEAPKCDSALEYEEMLKCIQKTFNLRAEETTNALIDSTEFCASESAKPCCSNGGDTGDNACENAPCDQKQTFAWFDIRAEMITTSTYGALMTIFVAFLLGAGGALISRDCDALVVSPIENMQQSVRNLAENPNSGMEMVQKTKYETYALTVALSKIHGLLRLGLGSAGNKIVADNLKSQDGDINLLLHGHRVNCCYGFCDIRQFTDTVECLNDQVMLFTNSVGKIIHTASHDNAGEPNKNIGDAFLLVWKPLEADPPNNPTWTKCVDGALVAFRRCVREVSSSRQLERIVDHPKVHKKFGPGYKTRLGYGLHFGWSVEGPCGSAQKIDCSYLGTEVKLSDRLEAATKIYSCNILMSGEFYDLLSDNMKVGIRMIDNCTLKGGHKPYRIYGDDRSNIFLKMSTAMVDEHGPFNAYQIFADTFQNGIQNFISGDWMSAKRHLLEALRFAPEDKPTKLLLQEMQNSGINDVAHGMTVLLPPADWKGYHESEI